MRALLISGTLQCLILAGICAGAQTENPAAGGTDQAKQIYAHAQPYMENPLPQLKRAVPALKGLKADGSQANLGSILDRTGGAMQAQILRIPDLIARESVWQAQFAVPRKGQPAEDSPTLMSGGRRRSQTQYLLTPAVSEQQLEDKLHMSLLTGAPWKNFEYTMLFRQTPTGDAVLEESRTDVKAANGAQPESNQELLHGTGFGYIWLLFLKDNIARANYRYLGQQKMYGRDAYVIAFAQAVDGVKIPGKIDFQGMSYPLFYQGVAWIDEATFHIVRLRTDLLAPLPGIQLQWLSSDLRFSEVRIAELNLPLWLPRQVELTWRQAGQIGGEMHLYAKYRLFHATARILPPS